MATETVTSTDVTSPAMELPPSRLVQDPEETPHLVACVLRYLAAHAPIPEELCVTNYGGSDIEYGRYLLMHTLADALDHAKTAMSEKAAS